MGWGVIKAPFSKFYFGMVWGDWGVCINHWYHNGKVEEDFGLFLTGVNCIYVIWMKNEVTTQNTKFRNVHIYIVILCADLNFCHPGLFRISLHKYISTTIIHLYMMHFYITYMYMYYVCTYVWMNVSMHIRVYIILYCMSVYIVCVYIISCVHECVYYKLLCRL